jgi:WXG100 family type VII secretion target
MMAERIKAQFGSLSDLVDRIGKTSDDIETELDGLAKQIGILTQEWTGAASDAFQQTVNHWHAAADDLRQSLRRLGRIVHTTNANYQSAVTTNTRMWPER